MARKNRKDVRKQKYSRIRKNNEDRIVLMSFNLSKTVVTFVVIILLVVSIITAKTVTTLIKTEKTSAKASFEENSENVVWVESTEKDADGNIVVDKDDSGKVINVPVPKGYTASKIDGETSANHGFVIYEGDIDWSTIFVEDKSTESGETLDTTGVSTYSVSRHENIDFQNVNEKTVDDANSKDSASSENLEDSGSKKGESEVKTEKELTEIDLKKSDAKDESKNKIQVNVTNANNIVDKDQEKLLNTDKKEEKTELEKENQTEITDTTSSEISKEKNTSELNKTNESNDTEENKTSISDTENLENEKTNLDDTTDSLELDNNSKDKSQTETKEAVDTVKNEQEKDSAEVTENANKESDEILQNAYKTETPISTTEKSGVATIAETEETTEGDTGEAVEEPPLTAKEQTKINIFNLQKTRNQYVWVPVNDISEIYGVDSNGKLWGKLYTFPKSATGSRTSRNWTEDNGIMNITSMTKAREPDVMANMENYDIDRFLPIYLYGKARYELLAEEMEQNFSGMIESIKKYGGFYIGRYETGGLNRTAVVRKMNENIHSQDWYTMYNKCQMLSGENDNVVTSMIWKCLWDATLEWFVASKATNLAGTTITYSLIASDSSTWGNYYNVTFNYIPSSAITPEATATKNSPTKVKVPTGSSEHNKVNNIYDMAGNVLDWNLATNSTNGRVHGGGYYYYSGKVNPASSDVDYNVNGTDQSIGCRALLLIK